MIIRLAVEKDARAIAGLHKGEIKKGFLSSLSVSFLEKLYGAIIASPHGFGVVAEDNGKVVGFIAGAIDIKKIYRYFFSRYFIQGGFLLFGQIFSLSTARKIIEVVLYPKKENSLPSAELLTIAIQKDWQGQGLASQMFHEFVEEMKKRNVTVFKVLVGEELVPAIKFYEKSGFKFHSSLSIHKNQSSRIYMYTVN